MTLNKKQTENLLDLIFSAILLGLSLISVYFFINGIWFSILPYNGGGLILSFIIGMGTFFGVLFGVIFTVSSIYDINDLRELK